jgi:hypothetical protein
MVSHVVNNICKIIIHVTLKLLCIDLFMILHVHLSCKKIIAKQWLDESTNCIDRIKHVIVG